MESTLSPAECDTAARRVVREKYDGEVCVGSFVGKRPALHLPVQNTDELEPICSTRSTGEWYSKDIGVFPEGGAHSFCKRCLAEIGLAHGNRIR